MKTKNTSRKSIVIEFDTDSRKSRVYKADGDSDFFRLQTLCDTVNAPSRKAALDAYLTSGLHDRALVAEALTAQIQEETKRILCGNPTPNFAIACCRDCFLDILSERAEFTFAGLSPSVELTVEGAVDGKTLASLEKIASPARLARRLSDLGLCVTETEHVPVADDVQRFRLYMKALREFLAAAARLAKAVGADTCALGLLSAVQLSYPRTVQRSRDNILSAVDPLMSRESAEAFYTAISAALPALWPAVEYARVKPLALRKKGAGR